MCIGPKPIARIIKRPRNEQPSNVVQFWYESHVTSTPPSCSRITAAPSTSGFCPPQIVYPAGGIVAGDPWEVSPTSLTGDALEFGQVAATTLPTATVYQYMIEWEEYVIGAE